MSEQEKKQPEEQQSGQQNGMTDEVQEEFSINFSPFARIVHGGESDEHAPASNLWLIIFTDVMALMLTFFVLLYSMSVPMENEWEQMTAALNDQFKRFYEQDFSAGPQDAINIRQIDYTEALNLNYLKALIAQQMERNENLENLVIITQKDRLVLSLPGELLFETGKAEVTADGRRALFALSGTLSRIRNRIEVIGHADPRPVSGGAGAGAVYQSNWELSLARAAGVAAVLSDVGYQRDVIVRGLSNARYDELPAALAEERRLDLARRVDIVIMKDDGAGPVLFELDPI